MPNRMIFGFAFDAIVLSFAVGEPAGYRSGALEPKPNSDLFETFPVAGGGGISPFFRNRMFMGQTG